VTNLVCRDDNAMPILLQAQCRTHCNSRNHQEALKLLLQTSTAGADGATKSQMFDCAMEVLTSTKLAEVAPTIRGLSPVSALWMISCLAPPNPSSSWLASVRMEM
jgi:hypothetical protein